jgi:hypothetical protein
MLSNQVEAQNKLILWNNIRQQDKRTRKNSEKQQKHT